MTAGWVRNLRRLAFATAMTAVWAVALLVSGAAYANPHPKLQLYCEGCTYDPITESWIGDISPGETDRIWAVVNLYGPGGFAPITDVHLFTFFTDTSLTSGIFGDGLMGGAAAVPGSFTVVDPIDGETFPFVDRSNDPTIVSIGSFNIAVDGFPTLPDGKSLPPHGVHTEFTDYFDIFLGDFTTPDSEILDFNGVNLGADTFFGCTTPDPSSCPANIKVIDVTAPLAGFTGSLHFDLVGLANGLGKFAPFSHDLTDTPSVAEPGTLAVFATGLLILAAAGRRRVKLASKGKNGGRGWD
ncbi:MAG: choice-of-anchor N protein [Alphaproteobacteria bacterium]